MEEGPGLRLERECAVRGHPCAADGLEAPAALEPPKIVTVALRPCPPCVTRPVTVAPTPFFPDLFAARLTAPGAIAAGETTAPATFGVPTPGLYGTHEEIQAPEATVPNTPAIVSWAL